MPSSPAPTVINPPDDYNAVPYPGHPYPATHPARLEALGRLHGVAPAPADRCRVLEVGCGDGANLIPLAYLYPESRFLGIDPAAAPIERGRALIAAAGLSNVELRTLDLRALPADVGPFDYLIAHGVYCWVPPDVAEALLAAAGARLAPGGIAFVSYNTFPGHHLRQMARHMMLYHTRDLADPEQKLRQAVSLLKFLGESCVGEPKSYHQVLREEFARSAEIVTRGNGGVFFHDELSEFNAPLYFHQFAARAAGAGLRFLCESESGPPTANTLSAQALETLRQLADQPLAREQYLDFLQARLFRQSLLCRADEPLNPELTLAQLGGYSFAGALTEDDAGASLAAGARTTFRHDFDDERVMTSDRPLVKAALRRLAEIWPAALTLSELQAAARAQLDAEGVRLDPAEQPMAEADLRAALTLSFHGNLLEVMLRPPPRRAGARASLASVERPRASALARAQCALRGGDGAGPVTNLCHEEVDLEGRTACALLPLLDGTRDRAALVEALAAAREADGPGGTPREVLRVNLETTLEEFRRLALLEAGGAG